MPTDSDRDSLARMFFTAAPQYSWQSWEVTSDGIRDWCRAKADEAMAAGWRKVGVHECVLPLGQTWHDCEGCGMRFVADTDQDHLWAFVGESVKCPHCYDLDHPQYAALADPAGANGGE